MSVSSAHQPPRDLCSRLLKKSTREGKREIVDQQIAWVSGTGRNTEQSMGSRWYALASPWSKKWLELTSINWLFLQVKFNIFCYSQYSRIFLGYNFKQLTTTPKEDCSPQISCTLRFTFHIKGISMVKYLHFYQLASCLCQLCISKLFRGKFSRYVNRCNWPGFANQVRMFGLIQNSEGNLVGLITDSTNHWLWSLASDGRVQTLFNEEALICESFIAPDCIPRAYEQAVGDMVIKMC